MKWEMVKFIDAVNDVTGGNRKFQTSEYLSLGNNPIIDQGETFIGGFTNSDEIVNRTKPVVVFGDHTKTVKLVDFDFCLGADGVKVLEPKDGLDTRFLYFYLLGTKLPNVGYSRHYKFLKEIFIPLPALATQRRIAKILDKADALRQKDQALLRKYDELAQAVFVDMFGDPVRNEKGWEVRKLGESIEFMTSGSRGWAQYYSLKGSLFLRINNVGYNELRLNDIIFVNPPNNAEAVRTLVSPGDILLSITADLGRTCVIPNDFPKAYINQHLALIRMRKEYNPFFFSHLLSTDYGKNQFNKLNKGGVKAGLNFSDIQSLTFLNPPINKQTEYMNKIRTINAQKSVIKTSIENSYTLFQSLLQKAFKGELVE